MSDIRQIPVGLDPSVSGLAGEVGERVVSADGAKIWDKTGASPTDWTEGGVGGGGAGTVASIVPGTGIAVDATDPANPIVSAPDLAQGADLIDADQTVTPGTTVGEYTMRAGTTTADRTIIVSSTGSTTGLACWLNIYEQAHGVTIRNTVPSTLFTVSAGKRYRVGVYNGGAGAVVLNFVEVLSP